MKITGKRFIFRWFIIVSSFLIALLILWNTYNYFQIFKKEEESKVLFNVKAFQDIANADIEKDDITLALEVITNNNTIPIVLSTPDGKITECNNIDPSIANDSIKLKAFFLDFKNEKKPIRINTSGNNYVLLYYGESVLLKKMKYYPIALLFIIILFAAVVYNFYKATRVATQNKLWAAMAKETAHQIGTPLSSLMGWLELLKIDKVESSTLNEIEKDIKRLETIAERFSKIGSEPELKVKDLISQTELSYEYLKARTSSQVSFKFIAPKDKEIQVMINPILYSWTIENLVKNAIDAMKGKGTLTIKISENLHFVKINVIDTGKGISKALIKKIFDPGFTTKKRGWGLGLSLTKRIVQDYHNGKVKVLRSEVGVGTTIQIIYPKVKKDNF